MAKNFLKCFTMKNFYCMFFYLNKILSYKDIKCKQIYKNIIFGRWQPKTNLQGHGLESYLFQILQRNDVKYHSSLIAGTWLDSQISSVYFINVLCTAFALIDPESVKITVKSSVSFYAFGIYKCKSCTQTLMKLSPGTWTYQVICVLDMLSDHRKKKCNPLIY